MLELLFKNVLNYKNVLLEVTAAFGNNYVVDIVSYLATLSCIMEGVSFLLTGCHFDARKKGRRRRRTKKNMVETGRSQTSAVAAISAEWGMELKICR